MSKDIQQVDAVPREDRGNHSLALGMLAGAAMGVGLGLLFAPRAGSELRKQVGAKASGIAHSVSNGCHRAKKATEGLAHRGGEAYAKAARVARETGRYVHDVSDALRRKSGRPANNSAKLVAVPSDVGARVV